MTKRSLAALAQRDNGIASGRTVNARGCGRLATLRCNGNDADSGRCDLRSDLFVRRAYPNHAHDGFSFDIREYRVVRLKHYLRMVPTAAGAGAAPSAR